MASFEMWFIVYIKWSNSKLDNSKNHIYLRDHGLDIIQNLTNQSEKLFYIGNALSSILNHHHCDFNFSMFDDTIIQYQRQSIADTTPPTKPPRENSRTPRWLQIEINLDLLCQIRRIFCQNFLHFSHGKVFKWTVRINRTQPFHVVLDGEFIGVCLKSDK